MRVIRLSSERLKRTQHGQIALTEKQMKIVEFINQNGKITNRDVQKMFNIASKNAYMELLRLLELGVIK